MITDRAKRETLDKILNSHAIALTQIEQELLEYLFKATLNKTEIKEASIAIDVFKRTIGFNSADDPIVRVRVYNIRKKLHTFYLTDGKNDKIRLSIPKGRYELIFEHLAPPTPKKQTVYGKKYLMILFVLVFILLLSNIYFWQKSIDLKNSSKSPSTVPSHHPMWTRFLQSEKPTLIVLGDRFTFFLYPSTLNRKFIVRDGHINSISDLNQLIKLEPELFKTAIASEVTLFGDREIKWGWNILPALLALIPDRLSIKAASEVTWDDIRENNIIFLGSLKTLYTLKVFLEPLHLKHSFYPHRLALTNDIGDTTQLFSAYYNPNNSFGDKALASKTKLLPDKKNYNRDYALVALTPGPNENVVLIFTGFYTIAIDVAIKYFVSPYSIKIDDSTDIDKVGHEYFEMLFEVGGFRDIAIEPKIIHYTPLKEFNVIDYVADPE
ncbi:hypothetical protein GF406_22885 [candidate division KSB1 bacterium]|nr:hypothetical protein [candidate division KSB1 bacterium]